MKHNIYDGKECNDFGVGATGEYSEGQKDDFKIVYYPVQIRPVF